MEFVLFLLFNNSVSIDYCSLDDGSNNECGRVGELAGQTDPSATSTVILQS
jgi:hypothetical protein